MLSLQNIDPPHSIHLLKILKPLHAQEKVHNIQENNCVKCIEAAQAFESESDLCDVDYPGPLVRDWVLTAHRR